MSYLDLLRNLVAFGRKYRGKLPEIWPLVLSLFTKFQEAAEIVGQIRDKLGFSQPVPGTLSMIEASADEAALEAEVGKLLAAPGAEAAFDGSRLRGLWKFLNDSGLMDALLPLLIKLLSGAGA